MFHVGVDGASVRAELGVPEDGFLVVLVSKLVELKGHEVLIRAIPRVLDTFPQTRFAVVGPELGGEHHRRYAEQLRRLPAELDVGDAVSFMGYRDDVPQIMAAADVITHCSTHPDPFPGVVLQGMSLGKAVIATDLGGQRSRSTTAYPARWSLRGPGCPGRRDLLTVEGSGPAGLAGTSGGTPSDVRLRSESFYRQISHVYRRLIHR